jgi:hypothetical protein
MNVVVLRYLINSHTVITFHRLSESKISVSSKTLLYYVIVIIKDVLEPSKNPCGPRLCGMPIFINETIHTY